MRAGLTSNAVSALERGARKHPYPHTVRTLADALGLSEDERTSLLATIPRRDATGSESPPPSPNPSFHRLRLHSLAESKSSER